ncbi:MAG: carboxypeptidase-like regulatory domain-containing protein [Candidatus Poribacteria bacterium]|nr:carboxypeptidase-like regulatory domain-containing protein [Candidatus Poribacteria bacterium]
MIRISLFATLIICVSISLATPSVNGQEAEFMESGATMRGEIIDTSPEQKPIEEVQVKIINVKTENTYTVTTNIDGIYEKKGLPSGRYAIVAYKKGYKPHVDRSKIIVADGEFFDQIKMEKQNIIIAFFQRGYFTWQLFIGFAAGILLMLIIISLRSRA